MVDLIWQKVMVTLGSISLPTLLTVLLCTAIKWRGAKLAKKYPLKLTNEDREWLVEAISDNLISKMEMGLDVDISAKLNEATQNQLDAIKAKTDDFINRENYLTGLIKKLALVIADLKSPNHTLKDDLLDAVNGAVNVIKPLTEPKLKNKMSLHKKSESPEKFNY